ncbi:SMODS domain-containing nucleotidyltransferase [Bacillus safensis]|uniref:SMODS domain-containing nucleotidyltransferase n=2 Tax=Bacillus safensis TaxID=561879 RepID=UPI000DADD971|nr:nucleotidyltransferase [Bacillus safensis]
MSVNSYLSTLSSELVLSSTENTNINTSITTLSQRLNWYFNNGELHKHFQFGSNTRGTILPRSVDSKSDVDYMVVFKNPNGYKPETLLNYLKNFMHKYYSKSEIYRDSPTMVLELNHIKFELVPAVQDDWGNLSIPSKTNLLSDWMSTDPTGFNQKLITANVNNNYRLKPTIRLMKYWNTNKLGHYYSSFLLEKWIVDRYNYFTKSSIKEYVYDSIEGISYNWNDSQTFKDKIDRAKEIVGNCKSFEANDYNALALKEIKKLFPEI